MRIIYALLIITIFAISTIVSDTNDDEPSTDCIRPNETYYTCGRTCRNQCLNGKIVQADPICNKMCFVGCDCLKGYVRNSSKVCVSEEDCN